MNTRAVVGDLADFVAAIRTRNVDVVFAAGKLLQQLDHSPDRLGNAVLADHEAEQEAERHAHDREDQQQS